MAASAGMHSWSMQVTPPAPAGSAPTEDAPGDVNQISVFMREYQKQKNSRSKWFINPQTSKFLQWWDLLIAVCLIYTALVAPFDVAFLPPCTNALDPMFLITQVSALVVY